MITLAMMKKIAKHLCFISFLILDSVKARNALGPDVLQNKGTGATGRKGSKDIGTHFGKKSIKIGGNGKEGDKGGKAGKSARGKRWSGKSSSSGKGKGGYAPSAPSIPSTPPTDAISTTTPPTEFVTPTPQPTSSNPLPTSAPSSQPSAEKILLYSNDFESPKQDVVSFLPNCAIDEAGINKIYGTEENTFSQAYTVEVFIVNSTWTSDVPYSDPQGRAGSYAISMLSAANDDLLGLSFETSGKAFVNVAMDISSIDTSCSSSFGIDDPIFRVSLLDDPSGTVPLTGPALDSAIMTGKVGPNQWTFLWTRKSVSLNATNSSGRVSVVFDLIQSGYGALDNLVIQASDQPGTAQ